MCCANIPFGCKNVNGRRSVCINSKQPSSIRANREVVYAFIRCAQHVCSQIVCCRTGRIHANQTYQSKKRNQTGQNSSRQHVRCRFHGQVTRFYTSHSTYSAPFVSLDRSVRRSTGSNMRLGFDLRCMAPRHRLQMTPQPWSSRICVPYPRGHSTRAAHLSPGPPRNIKVPNGVVVRKMVNGFFMRSSRNLLVGTACA